jgi:biopolymer transport protein ExbD
MHKPRHGLKARMAVRNVPEEDPEFQIAPMIDILLVLLVFFMSISSTQVLQVNEKVRLPVAKDGKEVRPEKDGVLIVNLLWNPLGNVGTIEVNDRTYGTAPELTPVIAGQVAKVPDCRILVRADKEVKYDYLRSVLKAAAAAGVTNITFSVTDKEVQK